MTPFLRSRHPLLLHFRRRFSAGVEQVPIDVRQLPTDYEPSTYNPASPSRPPPSDRVWRLVDEVSSLTLSETAELANLLLSKSGIPSAPPIAILGAGSPGNIGSPSTQAASGKDGDKKAAEEKTVFEIKLESFDAASKIKVIKEVRTFADLGLKEAKELVEKAPVVIKGGLSKDEATEIVEKMKAVGAKVVME